MSQYVYLVSTPDATGKAQVFETEQRARSTGKAFMKVHRSNLQSYKKQVEEAFDPNAPKWKPSTVAY